MPKNTIFGDRWVRREALAGDASTRRYWRLWDRGGTTAILAEYPPEAMTAIGRDLEVLRWFAHAGIRVPAVFDHDLESGRLVVEDLGDTDAESTLQRTPNQHRVRLLRTTLEPLETLARLAPPSLPNWNPALDRERMRWELGGFELWFVRYHRARTPSAELDLWLDGLADEVGGHPTRICHRDFHLNNLFFLADGRVGVIDVQDVLLGPDTYDGVSLLSERALPGLLPLDERLELRRNWAERTGAAPGWEARWRHVRLQRALKVLGTFARLIACGRTGYEVWMGALATDLLAEETELELPEELVDLLLD